MSTGDMRRDPLVLCPEGSSTDAWAPPISQTTHPFPVSGVCGHDQKSMLDVITCRPVLNELQWRLSPLGVVPQRDRRTQTISNYSFFGVNDETLALAPGECMQFGKALWRLLRHLKSANLHIGSVYLSNI
jgi:hypothetical protein